jgi:acetolactate synthase-1/2/3 large subunit
MKYSDQFADWLVEEGYTHCFYVAGGNIMHILNSVRTRMTCVPFVHEVAAGMATEYFNESSDRRESRAFALVTAGPGLTNALTAMAGAYLESRELLVVGGQVKSSDLASGGLRQRGIQEIDGIALATPVTVRTLQIREPLDRPEVLIAIRRGSEPRKGPVFIDFCLDAQGAEAIAHPAECPRDDLPTDGSVVGLAPAVDRDVAADVVRLLAVSERPVVLFGGGLSRAAAAQCLPGLTSLGIPIATTWNAADRIDSVHPLYFGRPNTWGMRWANVLLQQADLVIALGTRLGLQQTGFNWQEFAPLANVVQVDIDEAELAKGHPVVDIKVRADAGTFLGALLADMSETDLRSSRATSWAAWTSFGRRVSGMLPSADPANTNAPNYVDPFEFVQQLSRRLTPGDVIIPCSSGGAFTVMMQAFEQKAGQRIVTDKGLASMGHGLSGAIGASLAHREARTVLVEGDGGFAQNLQELGTVTAQRLNLKIFLFENAGYASIRMTQRSYFDGAYMGCDPSTGLGLPNWTKLFEAYDIPVVQLNADEPFDDLACAAMNAPGPAAFIVPIDPEQTFYPKINSKVTETGTMVSSPLHLMFPPLEPDIADIVMPYLKESLDR